MPKEIDVIGGSGFIGSKLIKMLLNEPNTSVRILDKRSSPIFPHLCSHIDVRNTTALAENIRQGAVIIHLAAEHRDDVRPLSLYEEVNVRGAANIVEAAERASVQTIVFTSSVAVYGSAPIGVDESGPVAPANEYGRTKYEAELIFRNWQQGDPSRRTLVIVRPAVVFGEQNRGNVYNLLRQIASGKFLMVGNGENRKSMAYVENVAQFLKHAIDFSPGIHLYNYVDKPDLSMNELVRATSEMLGRRRRINVRIPYAAGYLIGKSFDAAARISGRSFPISALRVKKFCTNSVYSTSVALTGFSPPISLDRAIKQTIRHEFLQPNNGEPTFISE